MTKNCNCRCVTARLIKPCSGGGGLCDGAADKAVWRFCDDAADKAV